MLATCAVTPLGCADEEVSAAPPIGSSEGSTGSVTPPQSTDGSTGAGATTGSSTVYDTDSGGTTTDDSPEPDLPSLRADLGGPLPKPAGLSFTEVTVAAGLDLDPGQLLAPPFCTLDNVSSHPDDLGDYCLPERILGAVAVGDFDGDDWPDIYMTRMDGPDWLLRNQGDGTFVDEAAARGLDGDYLSGGATWLDIEGDGDLDLMLTVLGETRYFLYVNDGAGQFTEEALERGAAVATDIPHVGTGVGVGDYDLDGYVDMFVAEWHSSIAIGAGPDHNRLLHNLGAAAPGHFEDVTDAMGFDLQTISAQVGAPPGAWGFAPGFVDLDEDGWPELTLAADYGASRLWWNDGAGGFVDITNIAGVGTDDNGMGSTFGDFDGDGDLDWFVSAIWSVDLAQPGNRMYRNDGGLMFTDVTDLVGVRQGDWGWGASFFDPDRDGDPDLALTSGFPTAAFIDDPLRLWMNTGPGPWPELALAYGIDFSRQGRGLITFDYDRDGDLDVLVHSNTEQPGLFRNDIEAGSWLRIEAGGVGGNSQGLGARVEVQVQPNGPVQVQQIGVGSHFFGQGEASAFFGLGDGDGLVHRVTVHWPSTGDTTVVQGVVRNQVLLVEP